MLVSQMSNEQFEQHSDKRIAELKIENIIDRILMQYADKEEACNITPSPAVRHYGPFARIIKGDDR